MQRPHKNQQRWHRNEEQKQTANNINTRAHKCSTNKLSPQQHSSVSLAFDVWFGLKAKMLLRLRRESGRRDDNFMRLTKTNTISFHYLHRSSTSFYSSYLQTIIILLLLVNIHNK